MKYPVMTGARDTGFVEDTAGLKNIKYLLQMNRETRRFKSLN